MDFIWTVQNLVSEAEAYPSEAPLKRSTLG